MKLYKEDHPQRPLLDGMNFERIFWNEQRIIERQFSIEEVWKVVSDIKGDKALGSDGFSISFFQKCWEIVKGNLMQVFDEFYYSKELYDHINTFIALIPKKLNAKELKDFRPIILLNSVYKIISKTLT